MCGLGRLARLGAVPWTAADAPPRNADPGGGDDVQDLLYLAEGRPYVFRLHLFLDGKPYRALWEEQVLKVFHYLDRDGDGVLSKEEVALAPTARQMGQMFRGVPYGAAAFNDGGQFAEMDADRDGKVTAAEFLAYYRRTDGGPAQLVGTSGRGAGANALTETLFKVLDVDKDGKLSKKELMDAEPSWQVRPERRRDHHHARTDTGCRPQRHVRRHDAGSASPARVGPRLGLGARAARGRPPPRRGAAQARQGRAGPLRQGQERQAQSGQIGLPKEVFDRYNADKDGEWTPWNCRWMIFAPDVETVCASAKFPTKTVCWIWFPRRGRPWPYTEPPSTPRRSDWATPRSASSAAAVPAATAR